MKFLILAFLIASIACQDSFLSLPQPSENVIPQNYTSCQADALITIDKAYAMNLPQKGTNVTFILLGSVSGIVQLSQVNVVVLLEGTQITTLTYNCSSVFTPGQTFEYKFVQLIPSYTPSGSYTCQFEYIDISGNQDGCTQVNYSLN